MHVGVNRHTPASQDPAYSSLKVDEDDINVEQKRHKAALNEVVLELHSLNSHEPLVLEKGSVWATAVALPQIARSANYEPAFIMLCFRVYLNFLICIGLSLGLLTYIGQETQIMNPLGGQMHLCDFGASLDSCPDGDHCVGPGGTKYTSTRLYGYTQWAVQKFVKQALLDIAPEKEDLINAKVDPGEYGLENYWCRMSTIVAFMMAMVPELLSLARYIRFFYEIPTASESWIQYPELDTSKNEADLDAWERVKFQVAGIPLHWKAFYVTILLIPRALICHLVLWEGVQLLMETSGITDSVLSAVSMTFVTDIGGMIFTCLAPPPVPPIMKNLHQPHSPPPDKRNPCRCLLIVPGKVILLVITLAVYVTIYYRARCTQSEDGAWVSQDMHLPLSTTYTVENMILGNLQLAKEAFWTMPNE